MTHSSEANFVAQVVKSTNVMLGVFEAVIFDEAKDEANQSIGGISGILRRCRRFEGPFVMAI